MERYAKANCDATRASVCKGWVGCGTTVPQSVWAQSTVLSIAHVITSHVIAFNAIGVSGHRYWAGGLGRRWRRRCGSCAPIGAGVGVGTGVGVPRTNNVSFDTSFG